MIGYTVPKMGILVSSTWLGNGIVLSLACLRPVLIQRTLGPHNWLNAQGTFPPSNLLCLVGYFSPQSHNFILFFYCIIMSWEHLSVSPHPPVPVEKLMCVLTYSPIVRRPHLW